MQRISTFGLPLALALIACTPEKPSDETGAEGISQTSLPESSAADTSAADATPEGAKASWVGSQRCAACHEAEFTSWKDSHHALAERELDPVLDDPAFDDATPFLHGPDESSVDTKNGRFLVRTTGASGELTSFPVERAFGVDPLRQYLVDFGRGRYQVTDLAYDPNRDEWFDVFGDEPRGPHEWGSWTGRGMTWNSMCVDCHATNVQKNYTPESDSYDTSYSELGVACEACHGPGGAHADWQDQHPNSPNDPTLRALWLPSAPAHTVEQCGVCHARREPLREKFLPGERFLDSFFPELPSETETFLADGRVLDEDFEYSSFILSRLHAGGVSCIDCHEPHSGKPKLPGDELCMSCHNAPIGEISSPIEPGHSGHGPEAGVSCADCHMPRTTYMQRHPRHDHSFSVPDPLLTIEHGLPNACSDCHSTESPEWALEEIRKQHGERLDAPRRLERRNRARLIARVRKGDRTVLPPLLKWAEREKLPAWRAVVAGLLGSWLGDPAVNERLSALARDEDPLVRAAAVRAMDSPTPDLVSSLRRAAEDEFRAVRVFAARSLYGPAVRGAALPKSSRAAKELEEYLDFHADQPVGLLMRASLVSAAGDHEKALALLERAEAWDPFNVELRRAQAQVLASAGRTAEALEICRANAREFQSSPAVWFDLGLALAAESALGEAATAFERAVALDPDFARAWYNLGLARNALGESEGALAALQEAVRAVPESPEFRYGLATVARDLGQFERALEAARELLRLVPGSSDAGALVQELQMRLSTQ